MKASENNNLLKKRNGQPCICCMNLNVSVQSSCPTKSFRLVAKMIRNDARQWIQQKPEKQFGFLALFQIRKIGDTIILSKDGLCTFTWLPIRLFPMLPAL